MNTAQTKEQANNIADQLIKQVESTISKLDNETAVNLLNEIEQLAVDAKNRVLDRK